MCSVRATAQDVYEVYAADGSPLARVTRRGTRLLPWPRRVRWTVETAQVPGRPFHGKVGPAYTWFFYLLLSPLWFPFWLFLLVYSFVGSLLDGEGGDDSGLNGPIRTRWRAQGTGTAMDYRGHTYRLDAERIDYRIAYAQAVLHDWDR